MGWSLSCFKVLFRKGPLEQLRKSSIDKFMFLSKYTNDLVDHIGSSNHIYLPLELRTVKKIPFFGLNIALVEFIVNL